ncbi:MAG: hypothetical protein AAFZ92_01815 [Pseudomonadota bacterium]
MESRSGALWEGRYKASPIQRDAYLLSCFRYVELNPVKAGMVNEAKEYPWLSYLERMGQLDNKMLGRDSCYLSLGAEESQRMIRYDDFIRCGISESEQRLLKEAYRRNQLTGNSVFIDEI